MSTDPVFYLHEYQIPSISGHDVDLTSRRPEIVFQNPVASAFQIGSRDFFLFCSDFSSIQNFSCRSRQQTAKPASPSSSIIRNALCPN